MFVSLLELIGDGAFNNAVCSSLWLLIGGRVFCGGLLILKILLTWTSRLDYGIGEQKEELGAYVEPITLQNIMEFSLCSF